MSLPILPKKVYLEEAIAEFKMNSMPLIRALETLCLYSEYDDLPIVFDEHILGVNARLPTGELIEDGDIADFRVTNKDQIVSIDGPKTVKNPRVYFDGTNETLYLFVFSYLQNDTEYLIPKESGANLVSRRMYYNKFYIDRDKLLDFIEKMDRGNRTPKSAKKQITPESSNAPLKALALLARDMADRDPDYRSGNKVNASVFKNHILNLASAYIVSDNGLKTLDDRINKVLKNLDIKELSK